MMVSQSTFEPIAIVGVGGCFPSAPDPDALWRLILERRFAAREVSETRWRAPMGDLFDPRVGTLDRVYSKRACLIDTLPAIDFAGLGIEAEALRDLDPVFHLALAAGSNAMRDAASRAKIETQRAGVIIANIVLPTDATTEWTQATFGKELDEKIARVSGTGAMARGDEARGFNRMNLRAAGGPGLLLARALGFGGCAFTLDAACASSLYAIKLACAELHAGRADMMIAGGVSRPDALFTQMGFAQLRALSPRGVSSPFDAAADGLVVGEGAGMFLLRRLGDALRDGDKIHGVIRGVGLSNDRGGSLLAPDSEGQLRAMRAAYASSGWSPTDVDFIECHATGTQVGDATEVASYRELWRGLDARAGACALGSAKSNIGHLLVAAGAAGLTKMLWAMREKTLPPTANFERVSPKLGIEGSPFRIQDRAEEWNRRDAATPRRAAVSAFGFGGINAHLLVEEFDAESHSAKHEPASLVAGTDLVRKPKSIAIVGMAARIGELENLRQVQTALFRGTPHEGGRKIESLAVPLDRFKIPPRELEEMLPQQLLALITADEAMRDAGAENLNDATLERTGVFIGIALDMNTTNYSLRWTAPERARKWNRRMELGLDDVGVVTLAGEFVNAAGPPLTANRTVGGLGGMVASRIARELRTGGPAFTISSEENSGLDALAVAVRMLQAGELDCAIAGAVDFVGDSRMREANDPHEASDGAVAFVLKPLDVAERAGDRVLAVIDGIAVADSAETAIVAVCGDAGASLDAITLLEMDGEAIESDLRSLAARMSERISPGPRQTLDDASLCAVGNGRGVMGNLGAASGLMGLMCATLALHHAITPPGGLTFAPDDELARRFHMPREAQFWSRNRATEIRRAAILSAAPEGPHVSVVVSEADESKFTRETAQRVVRSRRRPLGLHSEALFTASGANASEVVAALRACREWATAQANDVPIELLAREWARKNVSLSDGLAAVVIARSVRELMERVETAARLIQENPSRKLDGLNQIFFSPEPLGPRGDIAFVFPGSGNAWPGMGRETGALWPEVLRQLDAENANFRTMLLPHFTAPWRLNWPEGWENEADAALYGDHNPLIVGHVTHSVVMSDLLRRLGVAPGAVIGYSLGESASCFAMRIWRERDEMLGRLRASSLFRDELVGSCTVAREVWGLKPDEEVDWCVGIVERPADEVRRALEGIARAYLLIVNAPVECVIGGNRAAVMELVSRLGCVFHELRGISTVHCEVAAHVGKAYRDLHVFNTHPREGLRFYSCSMGREIGQTTDEIADSILAQATRGFDFPRATEQAYADGVRVFVEVGPRNSCSRMISRILGDRPHAARSACMQGQSGLSSVLRVLGMLAAERAIPNLDGLYGEELPSGLIDSSNASARVTMLPTRWTAGEIRLPAKPVEPARAPQPVSAGQPVITHQANGHTAPIMQPQPALATANTAAQVAAMQGAQMQAHQAFLEFSQQLVAAQGRAIEEQMRLLEQMRDGGEAIEITPTPMTYAPQQPAPAFDREWCLEFARGQIGKMLGPKFAPIDAYPTRVRLPDEPLMFVDRIVSVSGEACSMTSGEVVTEHDVLPDAWYLDNGTMPLGFSIEAGQADLFLSGYLGIDFETRGLAKYRLLDARVTFHRGLPRPGETIRYEIAIDRFIRQGDTHLFFFRFDGYCGDELALSMREGCAGFFTDQQLNEGRGVVLSEMERRVERAMLPSGWKSLATMTRTSLDDAALNALRGGDLASAFGDQFAGLPVRDPIRLPGGQMKLIDRVTDLDPNGGRYGLGVIRAEIDIHPDDWFLTCHFVDDMVMPGTLMYESCLHAMRVYLMRMGWIAETSETKFEPVRGTWSKMRCRGQVLCSTRKAAYEIHIKQLGYGPEPFAIADAMMYSDGHPIVWITDMTTKLTGMSRERIEEIWGGRADAAANQSSAESIELSPPRIITPIGAPQADERKPALITSEQIHHYCYGKPSICFGEQMRDFDEKRFLARLPSPPYLFVDRITHIEADPFALKSGGWIEAQYDVPPDAWYFRANRQPVMPFAVFLEMPLQVCGFFSAFKGCALTSPDDLRYRNLDGRAILREEITPDSGTLTARARTTNISRSGGMIILRYDMEVWNRGRLVFDGETSFGFFTHAALAQQAGVRGAKHYQPRLDEIARATSPGAFTTEPPLAPDDATSVSLSGLRMPGKALLMLDGIETYIPDGGPNGLGFIKGTKIVNPAEWFFTAHFYQDPVCPGSLGLESFQQLLKHHAIQRWGSRVGATHRFTPIVMNREHQWSYRGQILRTGKLIEVSAVITECDDATMTLKADGFLSSDGLIIYAMKDFGIELVPSEQPRA